MSWLFPDWDYRVSITIQNSQVDSTLTDFPVYVDLADMPAGFFTHAKAGGVDIRVSKTTLIGGESELAREVVFATLGSSIGELHFKADFLNSSADTTFFLYYGNSSYVEYVDTAEFGRNNVWSDRVLVHHLNNDPSGSALLYRFFAIIKPFISCYRFSTV